MLSTVNKLLIYCLVLLGGILPAVKGAASGPGSGPGELLRNAMIWHPTDSSRSVVFRKVFRIRPKSAQKSILFIFADSKYMLWINGRYIMRGPCRFDPKRPEYDSFEVTKYLHNGTNTIAVHVYGHISTGESMEHSPGLAICLQRGRQQLITDTSWRCSNHTRYGPPTIMWDGERENITAANDDGDWANGHYNDHAWAIPVYKNKDSWGAFVPRITPLPVAIERPFTIAGQQLPVTLSGRSSLFLKLSRNIVGYCEFEFEADSGSILSVFGHHYIARKGKQVYITGGMFGSGVTNTFGTMIRDEPDSVGIPVRLDTGSIRFTAIRVYNFIAPLKLVGSFHSSDSVLDRFWMVIANMHAQATKDTYTDGVSEGNEWVGDVHNISQFTRVAFAGPGKNGSLVYADKRYLEKALSDIGVSQQTDGRIKAHHPSDRFDLHWFIEDFACTWIADIRSYYEQTNDLSLVLRLWPIVKRQMDWFTDSLSAAGVLHGREWCVFDNPYAYKRGEGATLNAFVYKAYTDAAWLAGICGDQTAGSRFASIAARMKIAFNSRFWDTVKSSFRGMPDSAVTTHAAVMSLYTGICSEEHKSDVQRWLLTRSIDTNIIYPLLHLYWFKDLYDMDTDQADQQVLDMIHTKYNNRWNAQNKGYVTSEGCNRNRNFHNFGMVPGYFLSAYVLGVRPVGLVRDKRLLIEPRLGDLQYAEGTVVTEFGPVDVSWKHQAGTLHISCNIPLGLSTRVGIPYRGSGPTLVIDGDTVVKAGKIMKQGYVIDPRFIYIDELPGGHHEGKIYVQNGVYGMYGISSGKE